MPSNRSTPQLIVDDTFLIPDDLGAGSPPAVIQLNSMLIRGRQPVVVDTGAPINRERYLEQLFGLVEPEDVRWVFVSHDDIDHTGNLQAVVDACGRATLVTSWLAMVRLTAGGLSLDPDRWRRVGDGDVIDVGDRALVVQRPPLYDSPTTYGLLDTATDVYWAADCFAAVLPTRVLEAADVPADQWRRGFVDFQQWHSPWLTGLEARWWNGTVDRFAARPLRAIASAHGPILRGEQIGMATDLLRELPELPIGSALDDTTLDGLLAALRS